MDLRLRVVGINVKLNVILILTPGFGPIAERIEGKWAVSGYREDSQSFQMECGWRGAWLPAGAAMTTKGSEGSM